MAHAAVCLEKEILIEDASVDEVTDFCHEALKGMRLKIEKQESTAKSTGAWKTTIFATESAVVPLILSVVLFPFSLTEYVKKAQRSGMHVVVSSGKDGIHVYSCGLALDELTGKLAKYTKDEVSEEVSSTMEALDFENKFIKKILTHYPKAKQIR